MSGERKKRSIFTVVRINLFLRLLGLASGVGLALAGPPSEVTEPVRVQNAVGPEGQGNAAASAAWKKLAGDAASRFHRPV